MKGKVICDTCKQDLFHEEANSYYELALKLETAILSAHATSPHSSNHILKCIYEQDGPPTSETKDLTITCMDPKHNSSIVYKNVPMWLVNSYALAFHAANEGRHFILQYGDWKVYSPVSKPQLDTWLSQIPNNKKQKEQKKLQLETQINNINKELEQLKIDLEAPSNSTLYDGIIPVENLQVINISREK